MRTDLAYRNYGISEEAFRKIKEVNQNRLKDNTVCEICRINKSTRITGLGTLRACCEQCNNSIYEQIEEDIRIKQEVHKEYGIE